MPSCCTFLLKRRNALSKLSLSPTVTSDTSNPPLRFAKNINRTSYYMRGACESQARLRHHGGRRGGTHPRPLPHAGGEKEKRNESWGTPPSPRQGRTPAPPWLAGRYGRTHPRPLPEGGETLK